MKLGFIGLGKMGKPMALNLLKEGHELKVFNRSKNALKELVQAGAVEASSPAEVGDGSEVIFLCLPIGKDVIEIINGEKGILAGAVPGSVIIDCSTISPKDSQEVYEISRKKGVSYLDAPLSGGVTGAEAGTLSIMVGGDEEIFQRCRHLLEIVGKNIYYLGPAGSGNVIKLVNNLLVGITNTALAEAFVLAVKAGLDPKQVFEILSNATADSTMLRRNIPNFVLERNFSPAFTLDMLNKDLGLAEEMAADQGTRLLLGALAYQIGREASYSGHGGEDMSAVIKVLEKLTGVEVS